MKNKLYYVLFLLYAVTVAVVLYVNGVFTNDTASVVNLAINIGFLAVIGILFFISFLSFGRLNRVTEELTEAALQMQEEYKDGGGKNLWPKYQDRKDVFESEELCSAFGKYRMRIKSQNTRRGVVNPCELEEYINENLLDRVGMNFFNSGMSGTLTGLGILGTFLGLSMGLGSFNGDDIYTISDNVGPLLSGMKVAFHTSVYGILFSLIFNFVYRSIMSDAYEKLEFFLNTFRQTTQPAAVKEDENSAAMVVYQAGMSNALKQMLELMRGNAADQLAGVERITDRFCDRLQDVMGADFKKLGNVLRSAGEAQTASAENAAGLIDAVKTLVEVNRNVQAALAEVMNRQEKFAGELKAQKEQLAKACGEMSDEISNQLYAFEQMRNLYEEQ
ncbi:MAG: hypothetical protein NC541_15550 [bacterium]|nr:hypothetical protein [bacterium]